MYKTASQIADAVLQKVALSPELVAKTLGKHVFDLGEGAGKGLLEMQKRFPRSVNIANAVAEGGSRIPKKSRTLLRNIGGEKPAWKNRKQYGATWNKYYRDMGKSSPEMDEFLKRETREGRGVTGKNMLGMRNALNGGDVPRMPRTVDLPPPPKTRGMLGQWWGQRSDLEKGLLGAGAGLGAAGLGYGGYQAMSGPSEEEQY